jgi:hypothetical protein
MSGSINSNEGVMDVIMANILPAVRCRSGLSFRSRSSKICGLPVRYSLGLIGYRAYSMGMM